MRPCITISLKFIKSSNVWIHASATHCPQIRFKNRQKHPGLHTHTSICSMTRLSIWSPVSWYATIFMYYFNKYRFYHHWCSLWITHHYFCYKSIFRRDWKPPIGAMDTTWYKAVVFLLLTITWTLQHASLQFLSQYCPNLSTFDPGQILLPPPLPSFASLREIYQALHLYLHNVTNHMITYSPPDHNYFCFRSSNQFLPLPFFPYLESPTMKSYLDIFFLSP